MSLRALAASFLLLAAAGVAPACQEGSVGTEPISRCVPEGACDDAMFQTGLRGGEADLERGRALYASACATCHGPDGKGFGPTAKIDLTKASWHAGIQDKGIADAIVRGRPPIMPPMALSEVQLRDVVAYVRSLRRSEPEGGAPAGAGGGAPAPPGY